MSLSPGAKFRLAVKTHHPLQIVGTINPYCAMMAKSIGHQAIYLWRWHCQCLVRLARFGHHHTQ